MAHWIIRRVSYKSCSFFLSLSFSFLYSSTSSHCTVSNTQAPLFRSAIQHLELLALYSHSFFALCLKNVFLFCLFSSHNKVCEKILSNCALIICRTGSIVLIHIDDQGDCIVFSRNLREISYVANYSNELGAKRISSSIHLFIQFFEKTL